MKIMQRSGIIFI